MPSLNCYRLRAEIEGQAVQDFDEFIDFEDHTVTSYGPLEHEDFRAKLFLVSTPPHPPRWADFIRSGFGEASIPPMASVGALLIVQLVGGAESGFFAFTFGQSGRFLLRTDAWLRAYGLRTALNLVEPARLLAVDAKRRASETVRSRRQSSRATTLDAFELDTFRDVLGAATGRPLDAETWGTRVYGGDGFHFGGDEVTFDSLGRYCREIIQAHARTDYRERFPWLDHVQPITDPVLRARLEDAVVAALKNGRIEDFDLAPPEIVEWTQVDGFRFHFDGRSGVTHPDLRLQDYLSGLRREGDLDGIDASFLRRRTITAVDPDGARVDRWAVWRALLGELVLDGETYVLDEGEFFVVARNFLDEVNDQVSGVPEATIDLPEAGRMMKEDEYNRLAATECVGAILLDRKTVSSSTRATPVEICDLLTRQRQLVHVKRKLGSRELSHLFAQGVVSATALQEDRDFRRAAQAKVNELVEDEPFEVFPEEALTTSDFEVTYAIVAEWQNRTLAEALPFFSKVNLRRTTQELMSRGFKVSCYRVPVSSP